jgi:hypothetical protein
MKRQIAATLFRVIRSRRGLCSWLTVVSTLMVYASLPGVTAQEQTSESGVTFTKEFPGSSPAYYSVALRESGEAIYKTEPEDEQPIEFMLPPEAIREVFGLARKLNEAGNPSLESKRRVANMGKKTIEYRDGADSFTASFNHTDVPEATALLGIFERISTTQQHAIRLQYLVQFDRLGIVKALLQLESDLDHGRLLGEDHLVPLLERVRNDRAVVQLAKSRAGLILSKIQQQDSGGSSQIPNN